MNSWWTDRLKNGTIYVIASVLVVAVIGFVFWKVFLQKTFTQKTIVESGGVANYWMKDAQVKVGFGGCAYFPPKSGN